VRFARKELSTTVKPDAQIVVLDPIQIAKDQLHAYCVHQANSNKAKSAEIQPQLAAAVQIHSTQAHHLGQLHVYAIQGI